MDLINNSVQTALRRQTCIKHVDTLRSYFRRSHGTLVATNTARDICLMTRDLLSFQRSPQVQPKNSNEHVSLPIITNFTKHPVLPEPHPLSCAVPAEIMCACARAHACRDCAMPLELKRDCAPVWMHSPRGVPDIISVSFNRASI